MQFVAVGEAVYAKADAVTVEQKFGPQAAALVGDKWLKTSRDNPDFASAKSLTYRRLLDELNKTTVQGAAAPVAGAVNGQPAVTVVLPTGKDWRSPGTGPAYPLQIARGTDTMDFSSYDAVPEITAPAQWIDPAS